MKDIECYTQEELANYGDMSEIIARRGFEWWTDLLPGEVQQKVEKPLKF